MEVSNHVLLINDSVGMFSQPGDSVDDSIGINFKDIDLKGDSSLGKPEILKKPKSNCVMIYPVGRHVAFRSLDSNRMKILQLPNHVKCVLSL